MYAPSGQAGQVTVKTLTRPQCPKKGLILPTLDHVALRGEDAASGSELTMDAGTNTLMSGSYLSQMSQLMGS